VLAAQPKAAPQAAISDQAKAAVEKKTTSRRRARKAEAAEAAAKE